MLWHLVAHAAVGAWPLASTEACDTMWAALRRRFPRVVAAGLMPNHVHQLMEADDPDEVRRAFAQCLAGFARHVGGRMWQPVPDPVPVRDGRHLERQIRYVHLNPPRDGFVDDPLCWSWTTHRGAIGAELDPWVSPADMAARLCRRDVARWLHDYVSSDPSVSIDGTPFPLAAPPRDVPVVSLADIAAAAHAAARTAALRHKMFVLLARHQGWRDTRLIAQESGLSVEHVRRLAKCDAPEVLRVGALYLGDARLRHVPDFRRRRR